MQYTWSRLAENAPWPGGYHFQLIAFRDTLWVFHAEGNWYSPDGIHWTKSTLPNAIGNLIFLDYVVFQDRVFGLGHAEGDIMKYDFKPIIRTTSDMLTWTIVTDTNLPSIVYYHPFVFATKLWIIGGDDGRSANADIWNSDDGIHWTQQHVTLPFGKRSGSQFLIFKDSLLLIDNDVWSSEDALHWVNVTRELIPGELIYGHHAVVYDDTIWLMGYNRNGNVMSEVLMSTDGKHWTAVPTPWPPRGAVASCVFQNKLYMTGGRYGGWPVSSEVVCHHDLWVME